MTEEEKKRILLIHNKILKEDFGFLNKLKDIINNLSLDDDKMDGDFKSKILKKLNINTDELKNFFNKLVNFDNTKTEEDTPKLEDSEISDISSSSIYPKKNKKITAKYFILHHTAGHGTAKDVVNILNTRKDGPLGIQWVIDRKGKIFQTLPLGSLGAHIIKIRKNVPKDMSNSTAAGVEIIAKDDNDVLEVQCKSALKLVKKLGYSDSKIYGHGDVSTNRGPSEGQKCKTYIKNNR